MFLNLMKMITVFIIEDMIKLIIQLKSILTTAAEEARFGT